VFKIISFFKLNFYKNKTFVKSLRKILGFSPRDLRFYELALTHKSVSTGSKKANNERLEFLGDAILDAVISHYLFNKFPLADEGFLTAMRSKIVNGKKLSALAKETGIHKLIKYNTPNGSSTRIYEDAFEAFIGAIYLDRGYLKTENFIKNKILGKYIDIEKLKYIDNNFKSKFIEWAQKNKLIPDFYTDFESESSKSFISYLRINNNIIGTGKGITKKEAEQNAAKNGIKQIKKGNTEFQWGTESE